ncbi:hypothetical protein A3844_06130 [Paenibacillus helianthi]|uniref:F5/8 type C domain-containing protein n=1 Tax=Paenibacillus helianthi TaxID=1349432 RepID=A0ABX3ESQ9_9BACL|nr:discoidin domain-containing protein [Paenibacillus helianthi]OKP89557.1 hypothetical protein A3844_06130 [Paenibacillus helianthi]
MFFTETVPLIQLYDKLIEKLKSIGWTERQHSINAIPRMTANTVPSPLVASASSEQNSSYSAYYAFNGSGGQGSGWMAVSTATLPQWLRLDLGSSGARPYASYGLFALSYNLTAAPKNWTLEGSNDNSNWTVLDTQTNQQNWAVGERRVFKIATPASYRYYRINVAAINSTTTSSPAIGSLEFYESDAVSLASGNYITVLSSPGESGQDLVSMYLHPQNIKDPNGNFFNIAAIEGYNPNGSYLNVSPCPYYTANTTTPTANPTSIPVTYYLEANLDRIILATVMDFSANYPGTNAMYVGLIKRYSTDQGNDSVALALGIYNPAGANKVRLLRNKANIYNFNYDVRTIPNNFSPSVWGDQIFVSPCFLEGDMEGIRGELDGVYTCRTENLINEDEIVVGNVTYKVIYLSALSTNFLPYPTMLMKLPTP